MHTRVAGREHASALRGRSAGPGRATATGLLDDRDQRGDIVRLQASLDDEILGEDGRFSLERWGYQSQLSMPLIAGGRVIGLIELSDYTPRDFAEDLELIHDLGRVAARALENARLFEQAARRSRVLNELVEIEAFEVELGEGRQLAERVSVGERQ